MLKQLLLPQALCFQPLASSCKSQFVLLDPSPRLDFCLSCLSPPASLALQQSVCKLLFSFGGKVHQQGKCGKVCGDAQVEQGLSCPFACKAVVLVVWAHHLEDSSKL